MDLYFCAADAGRTLSIIDYTNRRMPYAFCRYNTNVEYHYGPSDKLLKLSLSGIHVIEDCKLTIAKGTYEVIDSI